MSDGMPGFVEVLVEATGETQMVPEHFLDDEKLGAGLTVVEQPEAEAAAPAVPESEVQLVAGSVSDEPLVPAARAAAAAPEAEAPKPAKKTAKKAAKKTAKKAAKKAAAPDTTGPGDTESSDETPAAGDKEN